MSKKALSSSLFDDIFRLQSTAPEPDIDPEDPEDGFKALLVDGVDEVETSETSALRRGAAVIPDDPKHKGKKASRKDLYSDDEDEGRGSSDNSPEHSEDSKYGSGDSSEDEKSKEGSSDEDDNTHPEDDDFEDEGYDLEVEEDETGEEKSEQVDAILAPSTKSDDRDKGKAVLYQLELWDDLIKSRIALQKALSASNRLPQHDTWPDFINNNAFRKEANNVHSSVRKVLLALLDLQVQLSSKEGETKGQVDKGDSDEEITSESEGEDDVDQKTNGLDVHQSGRQLEDLEEDMEQEEEINEEGKDSEKVSRGKHKRKLNIEEVGEKLSKHHTDFQTVRNVTLTKWDEKTRLAHGKVKAKNFAAFEMSVLKQIEQVLVNRERLVKRIHHQRSAHRVLGRPLTKAEEKAAGDEMMEDDDDEEVELRQTRKEEVLIDHEIIDDSDFYHVCLRDFIEMKQNEETDPVTSNKQWQEIQRLRNKQKRKVDTRASKGRKIRYHVKEKLKNYMTSYDKSLWSDEQKDDLFKALFGSGNTLQEATNMELEAPQINLGI